MRRLVLASSSPRRRQILADLGVGFTVRSPAIDETPHPGEAGETLVARLALAKARAATEAAGEIAIGADTIGLLDDEILGKPVDRDDARRMLEALSGRSHDVVTAIALWDANSDAHRLGKTRTQVTFRALPPSRIEWYLDTDEWRDKAAAYGIQGHGRLLVDRIEGNYLNVVGFPVPLLDDLMAALGYDLLAFRA